MKQWLALLLILSLTVSIFNGSECSSQHHRQTQAKHSARTLDHHPAHHATPGPEATSNQASHDHETALPCAMVASCGAASTIVTTFELFDVPLVSALESSPVRHAYTNPALLALTPPPKPAA